MRLVYRGASYEYNHPSLEVRETDILARNRDEMRRCRTLQENNYPLVYRGVSYTTNQIATALDSVSSIASPQTLIYRGSKYIKNPDGSLQNVHSARNNVVSLQTAAVRRELYRVHQDNLRRNLERRLQAAKARGDLKLVNLLEAESRELAL